MIKNILKSKSGTTLIELIVGMLITAILMTSVSAVLIPTLKAHNKANDLAEINTILDNIANQITSDISTAKIVSFPNHGEVTVTKTNNSIITYLVNDGILHRLHGDDDMPVLPEDFYKNKEISVEYYSAENYDGLTELDSVSDNPEGSSEFIVRIILSEKGGSETARRDYAVKPIILNQYN